MRTTHTENIWPYLVGTASLLQQAVFWAGSCPHGPAAGAAEGLDAAPALVAAAQHLAVFNALLMVGLALADGGLDLEADRAALPIIETVILAIVSSPDDSGCESLGKLRLPVPVPVKVCVVEGGHGVICTATLFETLPRISTRLLP